MKCRLHFPIFAQATRPRSSGFSLLEMLAVLAVVALAVGIVLPRLPIFAESIGASHDRETIIEAVASLGLLARAEGTRLQFSDQVDKLPGPIPPGWQAIAEEPIVFFPSGACSGGTVLVVGGGREFVYRLEPPRCRATLID